MKYLVVLLSIIMSGCGLQSIPTANNDVDAKWAEVVNQYKRRADLVPNLVNVVKGFATHEKETLEAVIEARAKATSTQINFNELNEESFKKFTQAQGNLGSALSRLMVVAERYPELKADQNFLALQSQLEGTENRITVARNRYIESINVFNNLVTVPPQSWTNSLFYHFEKKPQFSVENYKEIENAPEVKF